MGMHQVDPRERFSSRSENYVKYRPRYPRGLIDVLAEEVGFDSSWVVADIGSGTGFSTEPFLDHGNVVYAVEPNAEMRRAAEELWGARGGFKSVSGSAEGTTLESNSMDMVVAGQAFHWFDQDTARAEFVRILREPKWVGLFWNMRLSDEGVSGAYSALVKEFGKGYDVTESGIQNEVRAFFASEPVVRVIPNAQVLDLEGLKGRFLSASYAPQAGHSDHARAMNRLTEMFERYHEAGAVTISYRTEVYLGTAGGE